MKYLLLLLSAFSLQAASVRVDVIDDANIGVTHRVYYGTNSGIYPGVVSATNKIAIVGGLNSGARYYFVGTAVGTSQESAFSPEITHITSITNPVVRVTNTTQVAMSPNGPWFPVSVQVVDIPDSGSNQFVRVEIRPKL